MNKKIYIKTYGCQMNVYDSAKIAEVMRIFCGMESTDNPEEADLIILNTCSIREKAQEKIFGELGALRSLKERKPSLVIGVGGCVASQKGLDIKKRAKLVDLIFGPQTIHKLPEIYQRFLMTKKPVVCTDFLAMEKFTSLPKSSSPQVSSLVSIMEGCNKYCSYCIVPFTRGVEVSKPFNDVILECKWLVDKGAKEIIFLGQNVNDYQSFMNDGSRVTLAKLIHSVVDASKSLERIRFYTSYPSSFGNDLISAYESEPKIANHLHLPVQSGSDKILKLMRRRYSIQEFKEKIYKLRKVRPNISITSDFIVGFPGETEEDFQDTIDLVKEINFDTSFSFIYSKRPGTIAASMADDVILEEKKRRLKKLQEILNKQARSFAKASIGNKVKVIVTGFSKSGTTQLTGRDENNRIVNFEGSSDLIGKLVEVQISESLLNCLRGTVV